MLRDFVATVEQSRNQQVPRVTPTQYHARPLGCRNQSNQITTLLFIDWRCFPNFGGWLLGNFCRRSPLWRVRIIDRPAARRAIGSARSAATSTTAAARNVADVEDRSLKTIDGKRIAITVSDRAGRIDKLRLQDVANCAQTRRALDRDSRS